MNSSSDFKRFFEVIERHQDFLVTAHVNPDPDAICSELAMAKLLQALGKKVVIVNEEKVPARLKFLPGSGQIKSSSQGEFSFSAALVLDSGDLKRIGRVRDLFSPETVLINVDHHVTSHPFGRVNLVDYEASSTAEVIFRLFKYKGLPLSKALATLLYVGVMTDTGSFRYDNTSAGTHAIIAELMRWGIPPATFYRKIYETVPLSDFKYFSKVVSCFEVFCDGRVLGMQLPKRIVRRFSEEFDLRDKIFRELRTIKGVQVVFILTEESRKLTKVNLRSHSQVDVAELALSFGGGGHRKASGCQLPCGMRKAKVAVLNAIKKFL